MFVVCGSNLTDSNEMSDYPPSINRGTRQSKGERSGRAVRIHTEKQWPPRVLLQSNLDPAKEDAGNKVDGDIASRDVVDLERQ